MGIGLVGVAIACLALSSVFDAVEPFFQRVSRSIPFLFMYPRVSVQLFDPMAIGVVALLAGVVVGGWSVRRPSEPLSFGAAVGTGAVAVVAVAVLVVVLPRYWSPFRSSSILTPLTSPQVFIAYGTSWLFVIGMSSTRRQRYLSVAGFAALPLFGLTVLVGLIAINAGWGVLLGLYLLPITLAATLLSVVYALPLLAATRLLE
ncbi:hypothetical protein B2G88_00120 [Natronolimnobius baerhuensis]|uniref:Uncharacterized protein n=1 Tax=Natronolimnobius baerhuensis TaxID=253108 RepID=A0A202EAJ2_9EURY|nr:hypothetical protein B2G88_00120 [Natronolimnobius baerhuensis]